VDRKLCSLPGIPSAEAWLHASPPYQPHLRSRPIQPHPSRITNDYSILAILYNYDYNKYKVAQKERMFLKWLVVRRVKVGDLPTPAENNAEGSVQ
jgi:hypothetical protein